MSAGIRAGSSNDGYVQVNGNDIITALSSGNVGIGNTSPSTKLHVNGTVTATNFVGNIGGTPEFSGDLTIPQWIIHAGDTDTKLGFPSANAVDIFAGGKQVRLTSDGHLGINRTTPAAPITARRTDAGGTGTSGVIAEFANSSGYGVWFGQSSASGAAWGATTGDFYWNTGGLSSQVERLRINSTGKVTVKSNAANSVAIALVDNDSSNEIWRVGQASDGDGYVEVLEDGGTVGCKLDASGNSFTMGNFGVGVASPSGKLEIDAASTTDMIMLDVSGTNFAKIGHNSASGTAVLDIRSEGHTRFLTGGNYERFRITSTGQLQATGAADVRLTLGSSGTAGTNDSVHIRADSANLKFMAASGGATVFETNGTETLRIDSSGRVLIGTTTEGTGSGDDLTISNTGNMGLTLRSTSSNYCNIYFSDATSGTAEYEGYMSYNHATNSLEFATSHTEKLRITTDGYVHLGNSGHGTNKVGGQAITSQDYDPYFKLYSSTNNHWLMQLRSDTGTGSNGIFMRAGTGSSNYTAYFTGRDENNPHLIVRGDGAVLIGESTQSGMQRGDVVVHASVQSGNVNEPAIIHRDSNGDIIYFEHYFYCNKGGSGNSHTVNQDIIEIQNLGNFHQAVFHCWMGVRLQGQGDSYTRPATWQTGVNRFNGGSTIQKEENWISADSAVQTYANLHVGNANSTSYYVRMNWASGTYGSSFAGGKIMGTFIGCDVANSDITFAYGRT